jgi:hypothetical protein
MYSKFKINRNSKKITVLDFLTVMQPTVSWSAKGVFGMISKKKLISEKKNSKKIGISKNSKKNLKLKN